MVLSLALFLKEWEIQIRKKFWIVLPQIANISDFKPIVQLRVDMSNGPSNEVIDSAVIIHNDFLDFVVVPESMRWCL